MPRWYSSTCQPHTPLVRTLEKRTRAWLRHDLRQGDTRQSTSYDDAELVYQRGIPPQATYTFKHAFIQDAAYQSLLWRTRQQYHQRIAQVVEAQFADIAATQPELPAHHYSEAGLAAQTLPYYRLAGAQAVARSAYCEAVALFERALRVWT
jgi:predicted ATPase